MPNGRSVFDRVQRTRGLIFSALLAWFIAGVDVAAANPDTEVRIGVLAYRGHDRAMQMWRPTAQYLSRSIPGYVFKIIPLTNDDIGHFTQKGMVDFVLTNPASYAMLEANHGISRLATLLNRQNGGAYTVFGAVIFSRADRDDIRVLEDLKGKSFMAVHRNAFGGWWMAWRELRRWGIEPDKDFVELGFVKFPQDQIVVAVRDGQVDAGTVRTSVLERMAEEGAIDIGDFRVLNRRTSHSFPYRHSTDLYPEWPFAAVRHVSYALAHDVALALLNVAPDSPMAQAAMIKGWTAPLDYQPVHELMQELKVGPYVRLGKVTPGAAFAEYWQWLVLAAAVLAALMFVSAYSMGMTRRLIASNRELENEITVRSDLEDRLRYGAVHDALTDLPNRTLLIDRAQHALQTAARQKHGFALAIIDIDNFKSINDELGHAAGDKLLRQAAERFCDSLRGIDTIARLGNDEFVLLLENVDDTKVAEALAKKCLLALEEPITLHSKQIRVGASIGIAQFPAHGESVDDLLRHADIAMLSAKKTGNSIVVYGNDA